MRGIEGKEIFQDERIWGDGLFVEEVLKISQAHLERRYRHQAMGHDFAWLVDRVATLSALHGDEVTRPGRYPGTVAARSVFCYWAFRELGMSTVQPSKRLGISQPTAGRSVKRGEQLVADKKGENR